MGSPSTTARAVTSIKSETSYKSPPSTVSDASQQDADDKRGRAQERDRSSTAKAEDESGDDERNGGTSNGGKPRKRKRSRKGLEKSFACPFQDCGRSYSRAEHLYRHQLNRESAPRVRTEGKKRGEEVLTIGQTTQSRSIAVIIQDVCVHSCARIFAQGIKNGIQPVGLIFNDEIMHCMALRPEGRLVPTIVD